MSMSAFVRGVFIGMVAGVALDMAASYRITTRRTTVGKAMQRVGNVVDSALDDVADCLR